MGPVVGVMGKEWDSHKRARAPRNARDRARESDGSSNPFLPRYFTPTRRLDILRSNAVGWQARASLTRKRASNGSLTRTIYAYNPGALTPPQLRVTRRRGGS